MRTCTSCHQPFDVATGFGVQCATCFGNEVESLREQPLSQRDAAGKYNEGYTAGHLAGFAAGFEEGFRRGSASVEPTFKPLPPGLIADMLFLCHPDKHPVQSERANRVTVELISMRKALKAGA